MEEYKGIIIFFLLLHLCLSILTMLYAHYLNRRKMLWFIISLFTSPVIVIGILVFLGAELSKNEKDEIIFLISEFISRYEDNEEIASKRINIKAGYIKLMKSPNNVTKWEAVKLIDSLESNLNGNRIKTQ